MNRRCLLLSSVLVLGATLQGATPIADALTPGTRVLLDAHNCYPYDGQWPERIERALGTGLPLAIEQDLAWSVDPTDRNGPLARDARRAVHRQRTFDAGVLLRADPSDRRARAPGEPS